MHAYIVKYRKTQPDNVADLYALREQPDEMFEWLQRALAQHEPGFNPVTDPFVLAYQHDPRFVALYKQAGLPPPTTSSSNGR